jgi:hypothetical protein
VSWREVLECRFKGRPVVSAGGLFVIWSGWVRARARGTAKPDWLRYLAAAVGQPTRSALLPWFARHCLARARAMGAATAARGRSSRPRLAPGSKAPC